MIPSLTPAQTDLLTGVLSFLFTIAVLSYLIGDNPLYRLALSIFVGVAVGYATLVVIYQVLQPRLIVPLASGDIGVMALASVPLILFIFLALKLSPRTAALGNISIAYLVGVGTAVALGGALIGTLVPQIRSTWLSVMPDLGGRFINNAIIVGGTVTTLLYFQFWLRGRTSGGEARRVAIMRALAGIGQFFLVLTLATIYGGMILSGIAIFSDRLSTLYGWLTAFIR
jgi:hypothetical protein